MIEGGATVYGTVGDLLGWLSVLAMALGVWRGPRLRDRKR